MACMNAFEHSHLRRTRWLFGSDAGFDSKVCLVFAQSCDPPLLCDCGCCQAVAVSDLSALKVDFDLIPPYSSAQPDTNRPSQ